jgi:hypothetical protein
MKLTEKVHSTVHHVLVYGPPKVGKTRLVGTLAEKYKLIWFDLENGHQTLFQLPIPWQENIDLIQIPDTPAFPIAIQSMLKIIKGQKIKICHAHGVTTCALCLKSQGLFTELCLNELDGNSIVVIDSGTQLTESAIRHITKGQDDDYKMKTDDWGSLGKLMSLFYGYIQNAPFHVVVISHEIDLAKKEEDPTQIVPSAGSKNFARSVSKHFGDVVYCTRSNGRHVAASSTLYNMEILTGSRSGVALEKDKSGNISLLDLFDPDRVKPPEPETPGSNSLSALQKLRLKLPSPTSP